MSNVLESEAVAVHETEATIVQSLYCRVAALRAQFSELTMVLGDWYEEQSEVINRAEQVDAALQRLEWAMDRTVLVHKRARTHQPQTPEREHSPA